MIANWNDKHIGMPVVDKYDNSISRGNILYYAETGSINNIMTTISYLVDQQGFWCEDIEPDIAFIFKMLIAAGHEWVQWITIDKNGQWKCFDCKPKKSGNFWIVWKGIQLKFPYFPSPYDWKESIFNRSDYE